MPTVNFVIDLFCRVDDAMPDAQQHWQAALYLGEAVTLALLFALKGVGNRAYYRWLNRDYVPLFPKLPHRTRLFRLVNTHRKWIACFMADPTVGFPRKSGHENKRNRVNYIRRSNNEKGQKTIHT